MTIAGTSLKQSGIIIPKSPVAFQQDVIWGDVDAYGHVNNTVYLRANTPTLSWTRSA